MTIMDHRNKIIDIIALGLVTLATITSLAACPDDKSSEETGPASTRDSGGETGPKPATAN